MELIRKRGRRLSAVLQRGEGEEEKEEENVDNEREGGKRACKSEE